ncbi:MAG TPA: O-antigen ligase family protein [Pyrinomonadaceae bacterium]|nr:O-antigen ligase family protein [Pyrinomonadaceae bacterium]
MSATLSRSKSFSKESLAALARRAWEGVGHATFWDRAFVILGLLVSLLIAHAYVTDLNSKHLWLVLLTVIATAIKPVWALSAFLVILPVLGNRPTTEQFHLLVMTSAALNLTLAIKHLRTKRANSEGQIQKAVFAHPLMLMALLYFLASLASLTSLPWKQLLLEYQAAGGLSLKLTPYQLRYFLSLNETSYAYSILTVLLTQQAILLAFFVHAFVQKASRHAVIFCVSFAGGLALTLFAGVMDFYHLINLELLRALDPNINPGRVQVRLQSFLGHSGWLAEYIVLTIPYALVLLLKGRTRLRLSLLVVILMLGVYVTALTFQRGGWITYALTLLLVCFSIFLMRSGRGGAHPFANIKEASVKALGLFVLIVVVPLAVLYVVNKAESGAQQRRGNELYAQRLVEIKNVSERSVFFKAGYRLGILHPFLGGGSEGFGFLYKKEFLDPEGRYVNDPIPLGTLYSTAHNVYMQTFSGKGLWGVVLLLLPLVYMITSGLGLLKREDVTHQQRLIILLSICAACAFLIYGNMQEFFYIQSLQYIFFITLAVFSAALSAQQNITRRQTKFLWIFLAVGLAAHVAWEYGFPGQARKPWQGRPLYGCYETEDDPVTGRFNWCGQSFRQKFPITNLNGQQTVMVSIGITNPRPDPPLVNLRVELAAQEIANYRLHPNARYFLPIIIPQHLQSLTEGQTATLKFISDNLFNPAHDIAGSLDYRFLSIMKYETTELGIDAFRPCGPLEVWENGKVQWCTQNSLLSVPLKDVGQQSVKLLIRAPHADAAASPVLVTLGQLEYAYYQYELSNQEWKTVELPVSYEKMKSDEPGQAVLKLYVNTSRLWNPKKTGTGPEDRDFGVAIILPNQTGSP